MRKPGKSRRYTSATFGSPSKGSQPILRFIPSKPSGKPIDVKRVKAQREAERLRKAKKAAKSQKHNQHFMRHEMRLSVREQRRLAAKRQREAAEARKAARKAAEDTPQTGTRKENGPSDLDLRHERSQGVEAYVLQNLLGVSRRTLLDLAQRGIIRQGSKRGSYPLAPSIQGYVRYLRALVETKGGENAMISQTAERAKLAKARTGPVK